MKIDYCINNWDFFQSETKTNPAAIPRIGEEVILYVNGMSTIFLVIQVRYDGNYIKILLKESI